MQQDSELDFTMLSISFFEQIKNAKGKVAVENWTNVSANGVGGTKIQNKRWEKRFKTWYVLKNSRKLGVDTEHCNSLLGVVQTEIHLNWFYIVMELHS